MRFTLAMGRSLGFGSTPCNYVRPVRTRFRYGSVPERLNLATQGNSPVHYAKGTRSHRVWAEARTHGAPTACRHRVSGTISLPFRGSFHLSLTVLVRYRSSDSI